MTAGSSSRLFASLLLWAAGGNTGQISMIIRSDTQNENGFISLDKKREISDDIPQENWQLAIVAIAHYLRRYDA